QLPLSLLKTAQNHPMLVELKNGETYNGHLVSCDNWMNINLREVICTSRVTDLLSCSQWRTIHKLHTSN
uniref:U6 snRNA-associated Sm-like protein LSm4 n=1 Tax=Oryzias sinensis TaxID=183150 RepID=A0A8C8DFS8_9TELE